MLLSVQKFRKSLTRKRVILLVASSLLRTIVAYIIFRYTKDKKIRFTAYAAFYTVFLLVYRYI